MQYICFGYTDEKKWETMSEHERNAFVDACFAYDDVLRKNGHMVGGVALQASGTAAMLRFANDRVSVTDGPFAETKEQIGGIMILEANDLNHAIQLMSQHPSLRMGSNWEVRPAADLTEMVTQSERRRGLAAERPSR